MTRKEATSVDRPLSIGDLASQTGVTVEALRYYEQRGLVRPMGRRGGGYREYGAGTVRLVRFIRRSQSLGFTLAEVQELVRLRERAWAGDAPLQLRDAAITKVEDIDRRMRELGALRDALAELVAACDEACAADSLRPAPGAPDDCCGPGAAPAGASLHCPLIEAFDAEAPGASVVEDLSRTVPPERRAGARRKSRRADT